MNEKLKKLALKLVDLIPSNSNAQQAYDHLHPIWFSQKDYFDNFQSSDLIKLVIYVSYLSSAKSLDEADKIINKLSFMVLLESTGEFYVDDCEKCGSGGNMKCDNCYGTGQIECDYCQGDGGIDCDVCNGTGGVNGESCDNCNGDGSFECEGCGGRGSDDCSLCIAGEIGCDECDGSGEIETNELICDARFICSWSKSLNNVSEIKCGAGEPMISVDEFDDYVDEVIVLYIDQIHQEFEQKLDPNLLYCAKSDDDPRIIKATKMMLLPFGGIGRLNW